MTIASVDAVERSVQKANEWLADLDAELGRENRDEAWRILRAYLHVLRERLTIEEGAHLAAQLPHLLRGVFYEGFQPARPPERVRNREALLARLADAASSGFDLVVATRDGIRLTMARSLRELRAAGATVA